MQGSLASRNVAEVLRGLIQSRQSGLLFLQAGEQAKGLYLRDGDIVNADSNVSEEGLGYRLVDEGLLTPEALQTVLPRVEPGSSLADVLTADGTLTKEALEPVLRSLCERIVLSVFDWTDGTYMVQEGDFSHKGAFRLNTPALVLEGVRRMFEFDSIRDRLLSDRRPLSAVREIASVSLEPTEGFILSRVDGALSATDICTLSIISEEMTCRILYGLLAAGVIQHVGPVATSPQPGAPQAPAGAAEPSPSQPRVEPLQPEPSASGPRPAPPRPRTERLTEDQPSRPKQPTVENYRPEDTGPSRPRIERLTKEEATGSFRPRVESFQPDDSPSQGYQTRVEPFRPGQDGPDDYAGRSYEHDQTRAIQEMFDQIDQLPPHQVLGVPPNPTREQLDDGFANLSAKFHPNRNGWIEDPDLRSKLVFVFAKLKLAYKSLGGDEKGASQGPAIDSEASHVSMQFTKTERQRQLDEQHRQSQELYDEASRLYTAERYHDAREKILRAIRMTDDEARFYALLARIEGLNPNMRWRKNAENHWHRAIELDRWNAEYRLGLALLYKSSGMTTKAGKEFINVLKLDAANEIALAEVPVHLRPEPEQLDGTDEDESAD